MFVIYSGAFFEKSFKVVFLISSDSKLHNLNPIETFQDCGLSYIMSKIEIVISVQFYCVPN